VVLPQVVKLPARRRLTADIAWQFSILARVALAGVLLTGLYHAWLQVGSISAMWQTPYGRTLLMKHVVVMPFVGPGGAEPLQQRAASATVVRTTCNTALTHAQLPAHTSPRLRPAYAALGATGASIHPKSTD